MRKYVFSSTLDNAEWTNSTVVRGDVIAEVTKLKQQAGADLMVYGHGLFGETLLKHNLLDVLNLLVIPLVVGHGKLFFRDGEDAKFRLNEAKSFAKGIVKLGYEPQNQ